MDAFVDVSAKAKITVPKSKYAFYCELLKKSGTNGEIKVNGNRLIQKERNKEDNISYSYDEEKKIITISGTGKIKDFINYEEKADFYYERKLGVYNVVIQEGITGIGDNAFRNSNILKSVTLPSTLTSIGD